MVSAEKDLADSFKARNLTENVRWTVKLGTAVQGNPTVSNGRVFVGTDDALLDDDHRFVRTHGGMVQCLDEATGKLLWKLPIPQRPRERLPIGAHYGEQKLGVCSSPAPC